MVLMQKATKGLFEIAETIAEKEIEKDPLEFIRKESFVHNNPVRGDEEMFYSFKAKRPPIDQVDEEEEFDDEDDEA